MKSIKTVGTHSEVFHCDEVHGVMMLLHYVSEYKGAKVVRSRDMAVLNSLDIVIDVGGVYDFEKKRFDHHQKGFMEHYDPKKGFGKVKLSASGLIWKHFGEEIVRNALEDIFGRERLLKGEFYREIDEKQVRALKHRMYDKYFENIDGIDNGQSQYPREVKPLYR